MNVPTYQFDTAMDKAAFEIIPLDKISRPPVLEGLLYWNGLRGERRFPARSEISPRPIVKLLPNTLIVQVLENGTDFKYVLVGDEVVRAYRTVLVQRRVSEIAADMPHAAMFWKTLYRRVFDNGTPIAVRFRSGQDGESNFIDAETVLLPLGPAEGPVDHIIAFTNRRYLNG